MLTRIPRRLLSTASTTTATPIFTKHHGSPPTLPAPSPASKPRIHRSFPPTPADLASRTAIEDYRSENLQRLRAEAAHRQLCEKGTKTDIIERLEIHDKYRNATPYLHNKMRIIRNKLPLKALRRSGQVVAKQQEKPSYKLGRKFNGSSNRREYSTSTGSMAPDPSLPPVLPRLWEDPTPPPPIRVPILPDNDYARYHRREYVPTVAPPHKPAVLTATLDTSSIDASFKISELLEDVFSQGGEVGKEDEGLIAPRDDDEGEPMTKEKEGVMKTFAVVAAVWWVAGDGVMRALGVI